MHLDVAIRVPIEKNNIAIKRIESLCIRCGKCRDVCKQQISVLGNYDVNKVDEAICVHCGQCINVCPTGALCEKKDFMKVAKEVYNPNKKVVVLTSPSVRVALGEEFGMEPGSYVEKKMVTALRALGLDYVFDTTFAADLTIMEEASELLDRIQNEKPLPQFTSCCPAWVRFAETYYPEVLPHISSSKSPISMFGPTVKTYFAKEEGIKPEDIICVALTPCTAKKAEIARVEMMDASKFNNANEKQDVDYVVTTRELAQWMKAENIALDALEEQEYDSLMPRGSGAGVIFGNSGGVMEAALRTAYYVLTNEEPPKELLSYQPVRGLETMKEASVEINGMTIKVAVIHTLASIREFLATKNMHEYHFIEVMTCKGGCIGGGGQPIPKEGLNDETRRKRIAGLYSADEKDVVRNSHDNKAIKKVYEEFYGAPLSKLAEELLHTSYQDRSGALKESPAVYHFKEEEPTTQVNGSDSWVCSVCGYVYEGDDFAQEPDSYVCPLCSVPKELFEKQEKEEEKKTETATRWICSVCGYVYEGEDFEKEPASYVCPLCSVPKDLFEQK